MSSWKRSPAWLSQADAAAVVVGAQPIEIIIASLEEKQGERKEESLSLSMYVSRVRLKKTEEEERATTTTTLKHHPSIPRSERSLCRGRSVPVTQDGTKEPPNSSSSSNESQDRQYFLGCFSLTPRRKRKKRSKNGNTDEVDLIMVIFFMAKKVETIGAEILGPKREKESLMNLSFFSLSILSRAQRIRNPTLFLWKQKPEEKREREDASLSILLLLLFPSFSLPLSSEQKTTTKKLVVWGIFNSALLLTLNKKEKRTNSSFLLSSFFACPKASIMALLDPPRPPPRLPSFLASFSLGGPNFRGKEKRREKREVGPQSIRRRNNSFSLPEKRNGGREGRNRPSCERRQANRHADRRTDGRTAPVTR